jgi:hypothetical protein
MPKGKAERETILEAWRDAAGMVKRSPKDLATNPVHIRGLGTWRA